MGPAIFMLSLLNVRCHRKRWESPFSAFPGTVIMLVAVDGWVKPPTVRLVNSIEKLVSTHCNINSQEGEAMFETLITTELMCYGSFIFPWSNYDPCSINTFQSSCQFKISTENFVRWKQLKFLWKITVLLLVFGAGLRVALCLLTFNAFNGSWMLLGIMWPTPQVVALFLFHRIISFSWLKLVTLIVTFPGGIIFSLENFCPFSNLLNKIGSLLNCSCLHHSTIW